MGKPKKGSKDVEIEEARYAQNCVFVKKYY